MRGGGHVGRDKVKQIGLPVDEVYRTLQTNLGGSYVNDFNAFGGTFQVLIQAEGRYRMEPEDILRLRVPTTNGQSIPMGSIATVEQRAGPSMISRYNLYPAASVKGEPSPGVSSGEALALMEQLAQTTLPAGTGFEWTGLAFQQRAAATSTAAVFGLALLLVFLVLAAQYESWLLPISVLLAVPMGVVAAWRHRTTVDYIVMTFSVLGFSVPVFVIGYLFIQAFSIELRWLPVQGYTSPSEDFAKFLSRAILPSLTLATIYVALIARMTRASMLEVLGEDFIRTARAKGVAERGVLFRHALRNAAVPILTIIGTGFALLVSGVVVTESVFNIPGIGRLTVDAILARDYPVIQAMILLTSGLYVLINLLIDVSYSLIDPRIRY